MEANHFYQIIGELYVANKMISAQAAVAQQEKDQALHNLNNELNKVRIESEETIEGLKGNIAVLQNKLRERPDGYMGT